MERPPIVRLLPAFDEYTVAYHDRSLLADAPLSKMSLLGPAILVNGRFVGTWSRKLDRKRAVVAPRLRRQLSRAESVALRASVKHYGKFLGLETALAAGT